MNTSIYKPLSQSLGFAEKQIEKTIELLDSGATIPFISRYRKEATGSLDEVQIGNIKDTINYAKPKNEKNLSFRQSRNKESCRKS